MSADVPFNTSAPFTADTLRELIEATCSTTREFDDWVSLNGASASDDRLLHGMRLRYLAREFHAEQARYNNGLMYQGPVEGMRPSASTHRNPTQSVYTDHSHTSNIPWSGTRVQQQQLHQHSQPPQQQHYHEQFPPLNQTQQTWTGSRAQQQYMRQQAWATTASNAAPTNTQAFHGSDPQQVHPTSAVPHTSTHCTVQPNSTTNRHQHSDTRQQTATTAPRAYTLGDFAVGNQGTPTVRQLPHQQCEPQHQPAGTQYTDSTPASMPVVQRPTGSIRQFRYTRKPYKQLWKNASSTKAGGKQRRRQQHQQQPPQKPQQHGGYAQEVPTGKQHSRQTQQTGSATNGASNTPIDSQPNVSLQILSYIYISIVYYCSFTYGS